MNEADSLQLLARGEDSRHFKRDASNADGLTHDASIDRLDAAAVRRLNQWLGVGASKHVHPPAHPLTENVQEAGSWED